MRGTRPSLLVGLLLVPGLAGMPLAPSPPAAAGARVAIAQETKALPPNKGRELIDQALQALGGDAYLNATEFIREGRIYSFSRGELASPGEVFIEYVKLPDKSRFELGKKRTLIYINNGSQGWELDPQGIREQTRDAIARFQEGVKRDIDNLLRQRRTEPGAQFYYQGVQLVDNRRVQIVEMVDAENESYFFYLDAQNYLPLQLRYRERDTHTGEVVEVIERYGLYHDVQGIQTARQFARTRASRRALEAMDLSVQYNPGIPDEWFTRESLEERWRELAKKQKKKKEQDD